MKQLFLLLFISFPLLAPAQLLDTIRIKMTGLDGMVKISSDDAEQLNNEMDKLYDDDLDMGWEGDEFNVAITGLRFRDVQVPQGAVIDSAYVEIFAHEDEGDPALITIWAQNSDNAETFDFATLITARPKTTATVFWPCTESWTIWQRYRTPDIKTLIQEVVNRPGWQPENALALIFAGQDQGASNLDNARDFESFENIADPDDGGDGLNHPERIPKLYIYYHLSSSIFSPIQAHRLSVAPNPVRTGTLRVNTEAFLGEEAVLVLHDLHGRELRRWTPGVLTQSWLNLSTQGLPSGPCILQLRTTRQLANARLVLLDAADGQ